jgi:hypothetical protein
MMLERLESLMGSQLRAHPLLALLLRWALVRVMLEAPATSRFRCLVAWLGVHVEACIAAGKQCSDLYADNLLVATYP